MSDEPRVFPRAGRAAEYGLVPDACENGQYESDDSDHPSILPPNADDFRSPENGLVRTSSPLLAIKRAFITWNPFGNLPDTNRFITGDDTSDYAAPNDRVAEHRREKDIQQEWEIWLISIGVDPAHLARGAAAEDALNAAEAVADALGVEVAEGAMPSPTMDRARVRRDAHFRQVVARARHQEHLRRTVSAAVNRTPISDVDFSIVQLGSADQARHVSSRHNMLIQMCLAVPGFLPHAARRGVYTDDGGFQRPFPVHVPFAHRRLWVSLLAAPAELQNPHVVVAWRLGIIFQTAIECYNPRVHSAHSRAFARQLSHALKEYDGTFRKLNTTSDIQFSLAIFTHARFQYLRARSCDAHAGLSVRPVYVDSGGQVARPGNLFWRSQYLADRWIVRAAEGGVAVDTAVEQEHWHCLESDDEAASLRTEDNESDDDASSPGREDPGPSSGQAYQPLDPCPRTGFWPRGGGCSSDCGAAAPPAEESSPPWAVEVVSYPDHPQLGRGPDTRAERISDSGVLQRSARRQSI